MPYSKIKNEFKNLMKLKHRNIVQAHELYIDYNHAKVYMLMELIQGREMFDYIVDIGFYTGKDFSPKKIHKFYFFLFCRLIFFNWFFRKYSEVTVQAVVTGYRFPA